MQRRRFLHWSGASLVSLSAFPWLASCSNGSDSKGIPRLSSWEDLDQVLALDFKSSLERARALEKPMLVFIAPTEGDTDYRAAEFGDFLCSAGDDLWRDLALCEIAGASLAEIRAAIPRVELDSSARIVVLEHEASGPIVGTTLRSLPESRPSRFESREAWRDAQVIHFAEWTAALHRAIAPDLAHLRKRAEGARPALGFEVFTRVNECLRSSAEPEAALLSNAASLFLLAAVEQPSTCGRFESMLIQSTGTRVLTRGFSGAGWGQETSCMPIEANPRPGRPDELAGVLCGMGSFDEPGRRFVWFYTDDKR